MALGLKKCDELNLEEKSIFCRTAIVTENQTRLSRTIIAQRFSVVTIRVCIMTGIILKPLIIIK